MGSAAILTRGSSADRHVECAGPIGYDGPRVDISGPMAPLGTAAGEAVELYAATGQIPDLDAIAHAHGVDRGELGIAFAGGKTVWEKIGDWFPGPISQVQVQGKTTKGTADLADVSRLPDLLAVLDFKLGRSATFHTNQLRAYSLALVDQHGFPASGFVLAVEVWLMPAIYHVHKFDQAELENFRARLESQHARAGRQFAPGDWCEYCPLAHACAPRDEYLRAAAASLVELGDPDMVPREALAAAWFPAKRAEKLLAAYKRAVRLALNDGPLPLPDGGEVRLKEVQRDQLDPEKLGQALKAAGFDPWVALKGTKSGMERSIRSSVAKGKGAAAIRLVLDSLRSADGIKQVTRKEIEVIK